MKYVGDLEIGPVIENQVATDHDMHKVRRWRGKHDFYLTRARTHVSSGFDGNVLIDDQPALQSRRQVVAFGEPWRQMPIMIVIPAAQVAVMISVVELMSASMILVAVCVTVAVTFVSVVVVVAVAVVITIVAMTMIMILRQTKSS
jgi:hypothetical protein